jgi:hypothetical protein
MKKAFQILVFLVLVVGSTVAALPYKGKIDNDLDLIEAAFAGDLEKVKLELKKGASVLAQDHNGMTALIAATYRNDVAIAKLLINKGADVNHKDSSGQNAYLIAAREGYLEILKLTLHKGADVNSVDGDGGGALHRAGWRGQLEIIKELLQTTHIDINLQNSRGRTPLLNTITSGGPSPQPEGAHSTRIIETVRLFVEAGADQTIPDNDGNTPLEYAQERGKTEIVTILLAGSNDMKLITAAWDGDINKVKKLLAQGASVLALVAAADRNYVDIGELLIQAGADVNTKDNTLQSAYILVTAEPYLEFLQLTLENGADVFSTDSWGGNGIIRASERGYFVIVEELLKAGADVNHMNNIGWTGLIEAIWFSNNDSAHVQTVRVLIAGGADVCQRSGSGRTPLEYTQYPWIQADEIAEILIENGGDDCPE